MQVKKLSWRIRLAFGVGQQAEGIKNSAFGIFLLFYYVSVVGLSGTMAGLALLIALCFDGVTDPIMGSISDSFKSRWGRRHPFMYGAAVPFAVSFYFLFCPPDGLSPFGLFAWLTSFAVLTRGFMTIYSVPHLALNAELSDDYLERTSLASLRNLFSLFGYLCVVGGGFFYFFKATPEYSNGQLNPAAYQTFALTFAILMVVVILLSAAGTHSEIPRLPKVKEGTARLSLMRIFNEVREALSLDASRRLVGAGIIFSALSGTMLALTIFVLTYFWGFNTDKVGTIMPLTILGAMTGALLSRKLVLFFGEKKTAYAVAVIWFGIFISVPVILRLFELLPENNSSSLFPIVAITMVLANIAIGVCVTIMEAMVADVTDEHELIYGVRQEGIYYGAISFMGKVASGLGSFVAGIIIDLSGLSDFVDTVPDAETLFRFGLIWGPFPLLVSVAVVAVIRRYGIDRARHENTLAQLAQLETNPVPPN